MKKKIHGSSNSDFITVSMAADNLNCSETTARKLALQYGCLLKFGKCARIDWPKLYQAVSEDCKVKGAK